LVVTVTELMSVDELKLARVAPDVIVSVTPLLNAGPPVPSRSVTATTAELEILMVSGFMVSDMLTGTGGGGEPMVNEALLLTVPAVADISTIVSVATPLTVTEATPSALVVAVAAGVKFTAPGTLTENVTVAPLIGADNASKTVADTVVLPPFPMADVPSDTVTVVGTWGGVPIVIGALPLIVPKPTETVARMVAVVSGATAVNRLVATPDASVTAAEGLNVPVPAMITEKETVAFGTTAKLESLTTAVTVVEPPLAMFAAPRVT
jgi:hypothetical protein